MLFASAMGRKDGNFPLAHFERMALGADENRAPDPPRVKRFGSQTAITNPKGIADPIEMTWLVRVHLPARALM